MDERELMAAFSTWDRITLEVNEALRDLVDEQRWAELIVREYRSIAPGKARDPGQNVGAAQRFGQKEWRVEIGIEAIEEALR